MDTSVDQVSSFSMVGDLTVASRYVGLLERNGLTSLDALMSYDLARRLDKPGLESWRQRLQLQLEDEDGARVTLFMKRYCRPPGGGLWRRWTQSGHGTAWREWSWLGALAADGVGCAEPVAFAESIHQGREQASVLVTRAAPGESLERWAAQRTERCPRGMILALARFVGRFHGLGYVHRDLYLSHIFFDASAMSEERFRLIDLQRVMKPVWRRLRWRVKDLAALAYSTPRSVATSSDRIRFLRYYLGTKRLGVSGKRLVRAIAAKRKRIARHDVRRDARLGGQSPPTAGGGR